ncbi:putative (di)nucleoside polyphosphate hydrolase [Filomicrobium insigne]|uniref:RNA pyrophosphohydrolase n=1 Tax=Filomicrobium insigne TaxID=418854 RepID=A0A1H0J3R3_9HYPH|nr:RNA pyrophosphohydrolase [Filomicrobium insigne]SDO38356.1 putative (di)nucleoside polyphosphate hydrolase [Filomicrobium insigne]
MGTHENLAYRPCVGLMVINPQKLVWIGRRATTKKANTPEGSGYWWQMPQGGIEAGEAPVEAALRELQEETGITGSNINILAETTKWHFYDLPEDRIGRAWGGGYRGQKQKWFLMQFSGLDTQINITPEDPRAIEFDAWRWANSSELLDLIVPFKRDVYRAVLSEFGPIIAN